MGVLADYIVLRAVVDSMVSFYNCPLYLTNQISQQLKNNAC